jgi:hypothetical protein
MLRFEWNGLPRDDHGHPVAPSDRCWRCRELAERAGAAALPPTRRFGLVSEL